MLDYETEALVHERKYYCLDHYEEVIQKEQDESEED